MTYSTPTPVTSLALGLLLGVPAACATPAQNSTAKDAPSGQAVYVFESGAQGFNTRTVFYDDGTEVVAFDTQFTPELARQALAFLATKTPHPVAYAVVTHPNPDKFNGIPVFQAASAKVIMSRSAAAALPGVDAYKRAYFINAGMFTAATYPALGQADLTFTGKQTLTLKGGGTVELSELAAPGVSSTQAVAYIPGVNALVVGDLIHYQVHAWLEGGIVDGKPVPTLGGWAADLTELTTRFGALAPTVYGGRGSEAPLAQAVAAEQAYLAAATPLVKGYVATLGSQAPDYSAVQKLFEARFPGYSLGYMIGYGVYGLVAQVQSGG
jgi:glyoxylase-like metal-dependent hydrolase (beta-lactamase superfamily II)